MSYNFFADSIHAKKLVTDFLQVKCTFYANGHFAFLSPIWRAYTTNTVMHGVQHGINKGIQFAYVRPEIRDSILARFSLPFDHVILSRKSISSVQSSASFSLPMSRKSMPFMLACLLYYCNNDSCNLQ